MENNSPTPRTTNAKQVPPLTFQRKISGTTYIVSSRFSERAKEDMVAKVKRLILNDISQ